MRKVFIKDFLTWFYSDEYDEGFSISQKVIEGYSDSKLETINNIFKSCVVIPLRLVYDNDNSLNDSEIGVDDCELIVSIKDLPLKRYRYKCTTNTIWTSFDIGEVEATCHDEAMVIAEKEISETLQLCNEALKNIAVIGINYDDLEVMLIE